MRRKKIIKKALYPPIWVLILFTIFSAVMVPLVLLEIINEPLLSYIVYTISFYDFVVVCLFFAAIFPKWYRQIKEYLYSHPLGNRYMTDAAFRTYISLYGSLAVNLLYAAINFVSGIWYLTAWSITLAAYYATLSIMRFLLLRFIGKVGFEKNRYLELRRSRLCGIILMPLNIVLLGTVILIVVKGHGFRYSGTLIYVMAMYTFFVTVQSAVNVVKYRKYNSPVMSASRVICLTSALVSMLSLETAMLSEFGQDMALVDKKLMIIMTGLGVGIIIIIMSISMIRKTTKEIKQLGGKSNGDIEEREGKSGTRNYSSFR